MYVSHVNVRSLVSHFVPFSEFLNKHNYEVCGVSETWLHGGINDGVLAINNYSFVHYDRAGGVGLYIRDSLKYEVIMGECDDVIERL